MHSTLILLKSQEDALFCRWILYLVQSEQKPVGNHFIVKSTCARGERVTKNNALFGRDRDGGPYGFTLRVISQKPWCRCQSISSMKKLNEKIFWEGGRGEGLLYIAPLFKKLQRIPQSYHNQTVLYWKSTLKRKFTYCRSGQIASFFRLKIHSDLGRWDSTLNCYLQCNDIKISTRVHHG